MSALAEFIPHHFSCWHYASLVYIMALWAPTPKHQCHCLSGHCSSFIWSDPGGFSDLAGSHWEFISWILTTSVNKRHWKYLLTTNWNGGRPGRTDPKTPSTLCLLFCRDGPWLSIEKLLSTHVSQLRHWRGAWCSSWPVSGMVGILGDQNTRTD